MKTAFAVIGVLVLLLILMVGCGIVNVAGWFADRAAVVAKQELDPVELQRKYEWFKDSAAQLDSMQAQLGTYKAKIARGEKLAEHDRVLREQLMVWEQEQQGVKGAYDNLAAEYNAQMAKWNWRFCNVGGLPPGATQVLPREFKPYIFE